MTVTDEISAEREQQIWVVAWLDSLGDRHISKTFDCEETAVRYMSQCEIWHGGVWQVYRRAQKEKTG